MCVCVFVFGLFSGHYCGTSPLFSSSFSLFLSNYDDFRKCDALYFFLSSFCVYIEVFFIGDYNSFHIHCPLTIFCLFNPIFLFKHTVKDLQLVFPFYFLWSWYYFFTYSCLPLDYCNHNQFYNFVLTFALSYLSCWFTAFTIYLS